MRTLLTNTLLTLLALVTAPATFAGESLAAIPVWPDLAVPVSQRSDQSSVSPTGNLRFLSPIRWPTLQPFLPPTNQANGCAMVVCPGGAYVEESITKEGYRVAKWFNREGVSCFVLKYRLPDRQLPPGGVPWPLQDVHRAVQIVRAHAAEWRIDPLTWGSWASQPAGRWPHWPECIGCPQIQMPKIL